MKLILSIWSLATAVAFSGNLWFGNMEDGDSVEVTLRSTGCFHDSTHYYEVKNDQGTFKFTEYAIKWSDADWGKIIEKKALGTIQLSASDVMRLDGLLRYYRGDPGSGSTSHDSLIFEFRDRNGLIIPEKRHDGTGGFGLKNAKNAISFYELSNRLKDK